MEEDLHARLADELAAGREPPLGDLVAGAVRQGRRLRLFRRARIVVSTSAVVGVLAGGLVLGGQALAGTHRQLPVATAAAGPHLTIAPTPTSPVAAWPPDTAGSVIDQPAGPTSPTTPAAVVYRLRQLLPAGRTGSYTAASADLGARLYLDRGAGFGMLDLTIGIGDSLTVCPVSTRDTFTTCAVGPDGARVEVIHQPGNCVQSTSILVDHGDGVVVQLDLATCLAWNGSANPPGREVLSTAEAIAIAADPSWGARMSSTLVAAADQRFPSLSTG